MSVPKYKGILICSDFDGTLSFNNHISEENCRAIRYFQENGGLFTIVSGRYPESFKSYKDQIVPNTFVCGMNGTIIEDLQTHERIYDAFMEKDVFLFVKNNIEKLPEVSIVEFQTANGTVVFEKEGERFELSDYNMSEKIYKVLFIVSDVASDLVLKRLKYLAEDMYTVSRSWLNGIEIQKKNEDKGHAVQILRKYLGDRIHRIIGVGDYENDLPLLKASDTAVAVENAIFEVKAEADYIVSDCQKDSLAQVIYKYCEQK